MSRRARAFAIVVIALAILISWGFFVQVVYTFGFGESATATILDCQLSECTGQWEPGEGETESGEVNGAAFSDIDKQVKVRTSALGTFTDNIHAHLWHRCAIAIIIATAVALAFVYAHRLRKRGAAAVQQLRAHPDPNMQVFCFDTKTITDLDGAQYFTVADGDSRITRLLDGMENPVWTFQGEKGPQVRRIRVWHNGTSFGYLETHQSSLTTDLHNANGQQVGSISPQKQYGVPGYTIRDLNGRELGFALTGDRRLVFGMPKDASAWWQGLIFANMVSGFWLFTRSPGKIYIRTPH